MAENCFWNDGVQEGYRQGSTKIEKLLKIVFIMTEYKRGIDKDRRKLGIFFFFHFCLRNWEGTSIVWVRVDKERDSVID